MLTAELTEKQTIRVVLAGNPNCGKTTIFNGLTGGRQKVGNYPGVTVEKRTGKLRAGDRKIEVVDLPGTYSLTAYAKDEAVARDAIVLDPPDLLINVVDATNLERSLYLTLQLCELQLPMIVVLNMADLAERREMRIDEQRLAERLGAPVLSCVGTRRAGLESLRQAVIEHGVAQTSCLSTAARAPVPHMPGYGDRISRSLDELTKALAPIDRFGSGLSSQWVAIKTMEGDCSVGDLLVEAARGRSISGGGNGRSGHRPDVPYERIRGGKDVGNGDPATDCADMELNGQAFGPAQWRAMAAGASRQLHEALGADPASAINAARSQLAERIAAEAIVHLPRSESTWSDRIDAVLCRFRLGLPVFAVVMLLMFQAVFGLSEAPMGWLEIGVAAGQSWLRGLVPDGLLQSLLVEGVLGGVGAVLSFLPQIILLFVFVSVLEDCGYLARAAYLIDPLMSRIGLHGKSFVPLLTSFGCAIPGIMATRTLDKHQDRLVTMLVAPLMSCSARLPIYVLLTSALIPNHAILGIFGLQGLVIFAMYALGIVAAVVMALIMRKTFFRGEKSGLVLELPPYRMPRPSSVGLKVFGQSTSYLTNAGTLILCMSILLWAMFTFPRSSDPQETAPTLTSTPTSLATVAGAAGDSAPLAAEQVGTAAVSRQMEQSFAGRIGCGIEPILAPLGFDWRMGVAILGGLAAKEVLVGTLGQVYAIGAEADEQSVPLREAIRADAAFTPLVAISLMVFSLLSTPCISTLAIIRRESNSWRWPLFTMTYTFVLAWTASFAVYQTGRMIVG